MDRFKIFKDNVREIINHNSNPNKKWKMGINHLTDMTDEEAFERYHLMEKQDCSATTPSPKQSYNDPVPDEFNWVKKGVVSPVKDQKS